jgi:hypothetical protein
MLFWCTPGDSGGPAGALWDLQKGRERSAPEQMRGPHS